MKTSSLAVRVSALGGLIRGTPVVELNSEGIKLFAKLEGHNPFGSLKDRPAYWILRSAIERGEVTADSTIIESSSGNFASAVASYCQLLGLKFIPVVDPNITSTYEAFLRRNCGQVVKVDRRDEAGGFLMTRLQMVKELVAKTPGGFWTNQYNNLDAVEAHYRMTGGEICKSMSSLDYVFVGVSTAGTISGISRRVKEKWPSAKVIAVDAEGSVIFGGAPKKRYIPGIGASVVPELLRHALIDDVVTVPEIETVRACQELVQRYGLFVGGSSGSAYAAIKRYLPRMRSLTPPSVLFLCADSGAAYLDTIYNPSWASRLEQ